MVTLRESPLIDARPDAFSCPFLPFLLAKVEDAPYYAISECLGDRRQEFQARFGAAFQEYASSLIERIAESDSCGKWRVWGPNRIKQDGMELTDGCLYRDGIAIVFEHKALRPGTDFLRGGEGGRVLGPNDDILKMIVADENVSFSKAKRGDKGSLTRGMWQQSGSGCKIVEWLHRETGALPSAVFPILVNLYEPRMDAIVRQAYVEPLILSAGLYRDDFWRRPQWLHISDLESITRIVSDKTADLLSLLRAKQNKAPVDRFDTFLQKEYGTVPHDDRLEARAKKLLKSAAKWFFPNEGDNSSEKP